MSRRAAILAGLLLLGLSGCGKRDTFAEIEPDIADSFPIAAEAAGENPQPAESDGPYAVLHTTAGEITILLYPEQAPKAVENFITLAREGYYDGSLFHYAKRGELTQTGRPARDTEPERSIWETPFEDEYHDGLHHFKGAVGMAGSGRQGNLSQFYLLVQDTVPEDERVVYANLYMNELIRIRTGELNERSLLESMSEEDVQAFEDELNKEIQAIAEDGVPDACMARYREAVEHYRAVGGAWNLDYNYTVFGQIVDGLNIAEAITQVKVTAADRKPEKDVVIERIEIRE